jgi:hypothetical protein
MHSMPTCVHTCIYAHAFVCSHMYVCIHVCMRRGCVLWGWHTCAHTHAVHRWVFVSTGTQVAFVCTHGPSARVYVHRSTYLCVGTHMQTGTYIITQHTHPYAHACTQDAPTSSSCPSQNSEASTQGSQHPARASCQVLRFGETWQVADSLQHPRCLWKAAPTLWRYRGALQCSSPVPSSALEDGADTLPCPCNH